MKYIIEIDGKKSTRYTYNVWSVVETEDADMLPCCAKDARIFESDNKQEFLDFLAKLPAA